MSLAYAGEKLDQAVYLLAVQPDRIQGRLPEAWSRSLTTSPGGDLPDDRPLGRRSRRSAPGRS